jgi:hypothetical protein
MKKVIIITRETGYPSDCNAYKEFSNVIQNNSECSRNIHHYIIEFIEKCYDNYSDDCKQAKEKWTPLARKINLPLYHEIYNKENNEKYVQYANNTDDPLESKAWFKKELKIIEKIDQALEPKEALPENNVDNKPYVNFQHNGFDVHFVFLNRIFDTFVNGSNEYKYLIDNNSRLDFIKAICKDCGLLDASGKLNKGEKEGMLYIHDKEWYTSGKSYAPLQNGKYTGEAYSYEKKNELAEFLSTIKVFFHTEDSIFFSEIKSLNFPDSNK